MNNMRMAILLDRPYSNTNKGSNMLYLGDYESCNAGDISSRLYIEDSNSDIIEIEDTVTDKLELMKHKLVEIREGFGDSNYKPKLLFMVREGDSGAINHNPTTITKLYQKFTQDLNSGKLTPVHTVVNNLGSDVALFPFLQEKCIFGVIGADSPETLTIIIENLTNKILKEFDYTLTQVYNMVKKYNNDLSVVHNQIINLAHKLDDNIVRCLSLLIHTDEMERKYIETINSIGFPVKNYTVNDFVNGAGDRYSTINMTSVNIQEDEKEPYADVVIVAMQGGGIAAQCSFRVDKKSKLISNFYGDSRFFFLQSNQSTCAFPIAVKNRYSYIISTSWNCRIHPSLQAMGISANAARAFSKHLTTVIFDKTEFIAGNGRRYRIDMDTDPYGGRILKTVDAENGQVVTAIRSELMGVSGRTLKIVKGNVAGYFNTLTHRTVPGYQPVITDSGGTKFYPVHKDPKLVNTGNEVFVLRIEKNGGGSHNDISPWSPITSSGLGVYEGYLAVKAVFRVLTANLDSHAIYFELFNSMDHSRSWYSGQQYYDHGSNYGGTHTYNYVIPPNVVQSLGGMNTNIAIRARMSLDKGSSHSKCECLFYITTR